MAPLSQHLLEAGQTSPQQKESNKAENHCITSYIQNVCVPFSPTNGNDQVKTSMKFGNQYGWGEQLNCRMFITLFSYFKIAAETETVQGKNTRTLIYH